MRIVLISIVSIIMVAGCVSRMTVKTGGEQQRAPKANFSDASGDSYEDAVVITGVEKESQGVAAEYSWISTKHGIKDKDWHIKGQTKIKENGKMFDMIEISLSSDSDRRIYYFDVSSFSWKNK